MKKITLLTACIAAIFFSIVFEAGAKNKSEKGNIRFCTYNIRGDMPKDGVNQWVFRKDSLCKIVRQNNFDILCLQEVLANQLEDILDATGYGFVGIRGLFNPILYKTERFELLHNEIFWLSETMDPYSKGWDGKYDRYCTWAKFKDKRTKQIFLVFNTHLDHRGAIAKKEGATLICRQIKRFAGDYPVFLAGDMNSFDTTDAYQEFTAHLQDARTLAPQIYGPVGTAHNFGQVAPVRIDYIFITDKIKVTDYTAIDEEYGNGFYPSDHYAVFVNAHFTK